MGSDWYLPFSLYGYEFIIPVETSYRKFLNKLYPLQSIIESPFVIRGMLTEIHNHMEYHEENIYLDTIATIVIGFIPDNNLTKIINLAENLKELKNSVLFTGLDISENAKFYCGIEWEPETTSEDEESDTSNQDSDSSDQYSDSSQESDSSYKESDGNSSEE